MESFSAPEQAAEQLRAVERAEAAPYIHFPSTPWWYSPAVGAWVAAFIGTFAWWRVNAVAFAATLLLLVALDLVFLRWMRRRHGALPVPGHGKPPAEIASLWRAFLLGLVVVVAAVAIAWWLGGIPAASLTAFVTVTAGLGIYERRYAAAAARARERLR